MHTAEAKKRYKINYLPFLQIIKSYTAGVSLDKIIAEMRQSSFYATNPGDVPNYRSYNRNKARSKFWVYISLRKVMNHCWLWHITDQNGELTPKQLELFDFLGLDVPGTEEYINKLLKLDQSPIRLRIKPVKLFKQDRCAIVD
jgi:hypothetical protein